MRLPFCDHHISAFLQAHGNSGKPLDQALGDYLRAHKSIGAHDRRAIGDLLYAMARWKTLIDYFCPSPLPKDRLDAFRSLVLEDCQNDPSIPEPVRYGMPEFLYSCFLRSFGPEKTRALCRMLNGNAPVTIRANANKTTREALLLKFQSQYAVSPCRLAPCGIQFHQRAPLFASPEFKEGLFEVQDEGSQLVAGLVQAKPGEHVLDYCSGSGGKTLAFAPSMKGKGQIYLHDIRPWILQEARKRLKRAGIQNFQTIASGDAKLATLLGKMDWVLADVPCTGTGTLRRNPDAKWKIDAPMLARLQQEQRSILQEATRYVKPGGKLVYATCSLLPEENELQVEFFQKNLPLSLAQPPLSLWPEEKGMDGFFAAVFFKK